MRIGLPCRLVYSLILAVSFTCYGNEPMSNEATASEDILTTTLNYGFPVIVITTENGEYPSVDYVSPPEGSIGNGTTNATKVPGSVERYEIDGTCSYSSGEYIKKSLV